MLTLHILYENLQDLQEVLILPQATPNSGFSELVWFSDGGSAQTSPFQREQVIRYLEDNKISTRLVFGGNVIRQPAYRNVEYRIAAGLDVSDFMMNQSFWIGVYPGLGAEQLSYILDVFHRAALELVRANGPRQQTGTPKSLASNGFQTEGEQAPA